MDNEKESFKCTDDEDFSFSDDNSCDPLECNYITEQSDQRIKRFKDLSPNENTYVVVDIDGTVIGSLGRSGWEEASRVLNDLSNKGYYIVYLTSRLCNGLIFNQTKTTQMLQDGRFPNPSNVICRSRGEGVNDHKFEKLKEYKLKGISAVVIDNNEIILSFANELGFKTFEIKSREDWYKLEGLGVFSIREQYAEKVPYFIELYKQLNSWPIVLKQLTEEFESGESSIKPPSITFLIDLVKEHLGDAEYQNLLKQYSVRTKHYFGISDLEKMRDLKDNKNKTYQEIADEFNIPKSTMKTYLTRYRKYLSGEITKEQLLSKTMHKKEAETNVIKSNSVEEVESFALSQEEQQMLMSAYQNIGVAPEEIRYAKFLKDPSIHLTKGKYSDEDYYLMTVDFLLKGSSGAGKLWGVSQSRIVIMLRNYLKKGLKEFRREFFRYNESDHQEWFEIYKTHNTVEMVQNLTNSRPIPSAFTVIFHLRNQFKMVDLKIKNANFGSYPIRDDEDFTLFYFDEILRFEEKVNNWAISCDQRMIDFLYDFFSDILDNISILINRISFLNINHGFTEIELLHIEYMNALSEPLFLNRSAISILNERLRPYTLRYINTDEHLMDRESDWLFRYEIKPEKPHCLRVSPIALIEFEEASASEYTSTHLFGLLHELLHRTCLYWGITSNHNLALKEIITELLGFRASSEIKEILVSLKVTNPTYPMLRRRYFSGTRILLTLFSKNLKNIPDFCIQEEEMTIDSFNKKMIILCRAVRDSFKTDPIIFEDLNQINNDISLIYYDFVKKLELIETNSFTKVDLISDVSIFFSDKARSLLELKQVDVYYIYGLLFVHLIVKYFIDSKSRQQFVTAFIEKLQKYKYTDFYVSNVLDSNFQL